MWRKGRPSTLLVGMQIVIATIDRLSRFLNKLKIELPYDPAIPFLDIWLEETQPDWIHASPVFIVALFTITKT